MRLTVILQQQHIGNAFKKVWQAQSQRKILDFGVRQQLESRGIQVVDALEFLGIKPKLPPPQTFEFKEQKDLDGTIDESVLPKPITFDKSHPDWHDQECRIYDDYTKLMGTLDQGLNLTKTSLAGAVLPERITLKKPVKISEDVHNKVQQAILNAQVLDALQIKLPRDVHKTGTYGRNLLIDYGLPKWRKNQQLLTKLFYICDTTMSTQGVDVTRSQFNTEVLTKAPMLIDGEPILFDIKTPQMLFSRKGLEPYVDETTKAQLISQPLPSIYPMARTIFVHKKNIYRFEHKFPVKQGAPFDRLNMVVFKQNKPFTKKDTAEQLRGRLLVHTFGVAAAYAKRLYGNDVVDLPEPLTINAFQTDSQTFNFGCLQLHSLNLDGDDATARNVAWLEEPQSLFVKCDYFNGQPVLDGYNPQVFETLMAMYSSSISA